MRKVFLFIAIALMSLQASAQQPYNGSFEQWSNGLQPDGWGTWAAVYAQYNAVLGDSMLRLAARDSLTHANYPHDTISVRLTVDTITLPAQGLVTLAGFISYGGASYVAPPDTAPGLRFGYYPYKKMPDSLIFDYKYVPAIGFNDSALVIMTMQRFDSTIQKEISYLSASWLLDTTSQWTHRAFPLGALYNDTVTLAPDTIQLIFLSSVASHMHRGTTLWLDSVHFDAGVNVIVDTTVGITNIGQMKGVTAYPNPANKQLNILVQPNEIGSGIELYDAEGKLVCTAIIDKAHFIISTQHLSEGLYTIKVHSTDRLTLYSGRISLLHSDL